MALIIRKTGLQQIGPGGEPRVRALVIGGPGAGKTRWASYFPRPIYADTEDGLGSLLDRDMPYVAVNTSTDMLELLEHLRLECLKPKDKRAYDTVVIDTIDAYQRKLKDEWLIKEKKPVFSGWDAWGFLNSKMNLLTTRLLNLDMNVIVNVHYKDKIVKDDETGRETREYSLQLQGELSDTLFNDFGLVGWMGTYWAAVEGQRVQKRGLTFKPTPDKPFLKDRLDLTPEWLEVTFDESDYTNLFSRLEAKLKGINVGAEVGTIDVGQVSDVPTIAPVQVASPAAIGSGALPPVAPVELPLEQLDKPSLLKIARDLGVEGIRGNTIKAELVAMIKAKRTEQAQPQTPEPAEFPRAELRDMAPESQSNATPVGEQAESVAGEVTVDPSTGEILTEEKAPIPTQAEAVTNVVEGLGATVVIEHVTPGAKPEPATAAAAPAAEGDLGKCDDCGNTIPKTREAMDFIKISRIKFKSAKPGQTAVTNGLCKGCYGVRKAA